MEKLISSLRAAAVAASCLFLLSCAANQEVRDASVQMAGRMAELEKGFPKAADSTNKKRVIFRDGSYLGNKMVAVSTEKLLPPVFSKPVDNPVKLVSDEGAVNLPRFAEIITTYTGIRVEINQNIYLKSSALPSGAKGATVPSGQAGGSEQVGNNAFENERNITLDYKGSLAKYLDLVASKLGISWEYDAGRIHFFRYKSKSFEVKGLLDKFEQDTSFTTSGDIGTTAGASSSTAGVQTKLKSEKRHEYFKDLTAQVSSRLSAGGKVAPNQASNTIVVTDTPETLRDIGQFIEDMNRRSSRVAYFNVALYRLSNTTNNQAGLNWAGLLTSNKYRLIAAPGASLVTEPGGIGIYRLAPTAGPLPTQAFPGNAADGLTGSEGSNLLLQAIRQMTGVSEEWFDNGYTINNMPLPFTNSTTKEYVAETGTQQSATATTTTVKQKEYSFGVNIELTPHIYDNNSMLLEMVVDVTDGVPFEVTTVNGTQVKSKTVPRRATRQVLMVRPGEQIVLAKLGRNQNSGKDSLGLTAFSATADQQKDSMLLVITPVLWRAPT